MTAGGVPDPGDARRSADDVVHRGVRWQRSAGGALRWRDAAGGEWVRYQRGDDAPPRPPGWDGAGLVGVLRSRPTMVRPGWRSPYRIVPLVVLAAIIVVAALQAGARLGGQVAAEGRAAAALVGRCLARDGTAGGQPRYRSAPVACSAPAAAARVRSVLPGTPGAPACPAGTASVQLAYPGVRYPHQLCVVAR